MFESTIMTRPLGMGWMTLYLNEKENQNVILKRKEIDIVFMHL